MLCEHCVFIHTCPEANFKDDPDVVTICLDFKSVKGSQRSVVSMDSEEDMYD